MILGLLDYMVKEKPGKLLRNQQVYLVFYWEKILKKRRIKN